MSNELTQAGTWDPKELDTILQQAGAIPEQGERFNRMKVDGPNFTAENDAWQTPVRGGGPAMVVRIVQPPEEFQSKWFTQADATITGRDDMVNQFCKSRFAVPAEAREFGTNHTNCRECPFNPFLKGVPNKCSWKGDIRLQVFPEGDDVELTGEEEEYVLTINMSGMIEWGGFNNNPTAGSVSEFHFIKQLNVFSIANAESLWGFEVTSNILALKAINMAMTQLNSGKVAAELRSVKKVDEAKGREWYLPSFTPILIEPMDPDMVQVEAGDLPDLGDDIT